MPKDKAYINTLIAKLNGVDNKITNFSERLKLLKQIVNEQCENSEPEEECPDVAESDKAVVKAIEELFVEELLTREPEGDA